MFLSSNEKKECCGCTACMSICPAKAIRMTDDEDGFSFPQIVDEKICISCGLCEAVCPMSNFQKPDNSPKCYYGWIQNTEIYNLSTSGGAFSALCIWAEESGYTDVYGAAYSADGTVVHRSVTIDHFRELTGTKYVQSSLEGVFGEIRQKLDDGKKVVFTGTPCQVEGLLMFIGSKGRANLFTISLVCHNTASPRVFRKYVEEVGEVAYVRFRDKRFTEKGRSVTTIVYDDGHEEPQTQNPYTTAFGLGLMSRYSCNVCPFTTVYRNSDVTIGDFWGLAEAKPELKKRCEKGVSLILAHTEKGRQAVEATGRYFDLTEVEVSVAVNDKQPQLSHPTERNPRRDRFIRETLSDNKSFIKSANREIRRWKNRNRIKRFLHI